MEDNKMTVKRMEERLYNDYMALVAKENRINKKIEELNIRIDSMDIAREEYERAAQMSC